MGKEMWLFREFSALLGNTDDEGVRTLLCSALGFDLSVAPTVHSLLCLSPHRWQCLPVPLSGPCIKEAAKHVLVCHLLQVEKGRN